MNEQVHDKNGLHEQLRVLKNRLANASLDRAMRVLVFFSRTWRRNRIQQAWCTWFTLKVADRTIPAIHPQEQCTELVCSKESKSDKHDAEHLQHLLQLIVLETVLRSKLGTQQVRAALLIWKGEVRAWQEAPRNARACLRVLAFQTQQYKLRTLQISWQRWAGEWRRWAQRKVTRKSIIQQRQQSRQHELEVLRLRNELRHRRHAHALGHLRVSGRSVRLKFELWAFTKWIRDIEKERDSLQRMSMFEQLKLRLAREREGHCHRTIHRCLNRIMHRVLAGGWYKWHFNVVVVRRHGRVMHRCLGCIANRALSSAWHQWQQSISCEKRICRVALRCLNRIAHMHQAQGWRKWCEFVRYSLRSGSVCELEELKLRLAREREGHCHRTIHRCLNRIMHRVLAGGWYKWHFNVVVVRRHGRVMHRCLGCIANRALSSAWHQWQQSQYYAVFVARVMKLSLGRMVNRSLSDAWHQWQQSYSHENRAICVVLRCLEHIAHVHQSQAWNKWCECDRHSLLLSEFDAEFQQLMARSASERDAYRSRSVLRCVVRHTRSQLTFALKKWVDVMVRMGSYSRFIQRWLGCIANKNVSSAWRQWQLWVHHQERSRHELQTRFRNLSFLYRVSLSRHLSRAWQQWFSWSCFVTRQSSVSAANIAKHTVVLPATTWIQRLAHHVLRMAWATWKSQYSSLIWHEMALAKQTTVAWRRQALDHLSRIGPLRRRHAAHLLAAVLQRLYCRRLNLMQRNGDEKETRYCIQSTASHCLVVMWALQHWKCCCACQRHRADVEYLGQELRQQHNEILQLTQQRLTQHSRPGETERQQRQEHLHQDNRSHFSHHHHSHHHQQQKQQHEQQQQQQQLLIAQESLCALREQEGRREQEAFRFQAQAAALKQEASALKQNSSAVRQEAAAANEQLMVSQQEALAWKRRARDLAAQCSMFEKESSALKKQLVCVMGDTEQLLRMEGTWDQQVCVSFHTHKSH